MDCLSLCKSEHACVLCFAIVWHVSLVHQLSVWPVPDALARALDATVPEEGDLAHCLQREQPTKGIANCRVGRAAVIGRTYGWDASITLRGAAHEATQNLCHFQSLGLPLSAWKDASIEDKSVVVPSFQRSFWLISPPQDASVARMKK